jgi:hypothetical protein
MAPTSGTRRVFLSAILLLVILLSIRTSAKPLNKPHPQKSIQMPPPMQATVKFKHGRLYVSFVFGFVCVAFYVSLTRLIKSNAIFKLFDNTLDSGTRIEGRWNGGLHKDQEHTFFVYIYSTCKKISDGVYFRFDVTKSFTPNYVNRDGVSEPFRRTELSFYFGRDVPTVLVAYRKVIKVSIRRLSANRVTLFPRSLLMPLVPTVMGFLHSLSPVRFFSHRLRIKTPIGLLPSADLRPRFSPSSHCQVRCTSKPAAFRLFGNRKTTWR